MRLNTTPTNRRNAARRESRSKKIQGTITTMLLYYLIRRNLIICDQRFLDVVMSIKCNSQSVLVRKRTIRDDLRKLTGMLECSIENPRNAPYYSERLPCVKVELTLNTFVNSHHNLSCNEG